MADERMVPNCPLQNSFENVKVFDRCPGIPGYEVCLSCPVIGEPRGIYSQSLEQLYLSMGNMVSSEEIISRWQVRKLVLLQG